MRKLIARIVGLWRGRNLREYQRCYHCGAPCRTGGGFHCPIEYSREFCTNRLCANYVPF